MNTKIFNISFWRKCFSSNPVSLWNIVFCLITRNRQFRRSVKSNPSKLSLFFGFGKNSSLGVHTRQKVFIRRFLIVENHMLTMMLMEYRIIRCVIQFTVYVRLGNVGGLLYLGYSTSMSPFFFWVVLLSDLASYCL